MLESFFNNFLLKFFISLAKYVQIWSKTCQKVKKAYISLSFTYVLHLISLDFNSFLSQTVKKFVLAGKHRMVEYGDNFTS